MLTKRSVLLLVVLSLSIFTFGQDYATPESPSRQGISNILGAGARALGMGGAFTAVADDATAASWNPAGLAQLTKPEASLVFDSFSGSLNTDWDYSRTFDEGYVYQGVQTFQDGHADYNAISFASATYPFNLKDHPFVGQISYHRLSTFPRMDQSWVERWALLDSDNFFYDSEIYNYDQSSEYQGGIDATTLSLATELFSNFRVGLSLNYMDADITNKNALNYSATYQDYVNGGTAVWDYWRKDTFAYTFSDFNYDIGIQWKASEVITLGAVYHAKFTTDIDYESSSDIFDSSIPYLYDTVTDRGKSELTWPDGYGLGIAIHPNPTLTLALDYSVTNWSKAKMDTISTAGFLYDSDNDIWVPATFTGQDVPYPYFSYGEQEDTSSWRVGCEYVLLFTNGVAIPLRTGYFREDQIVNYWGSGSAPTYDGYTLGTGVTYKRFQFDVAWVHTWGDETGYWKDVVAEGVTDSQLSHSSISNNRILASLIIRFE